jgi:serine/threonine-protein kinase
MLAGRTPFEGDSPVALLVQHTHAPPPDLSSIARASYVPRPIADVVMQNLSKRAADRAQNARVLGRDLVAAARDAGLDPDEIIATSTLAFQRGKGAVRLPSKERTRQHELSAELAARIGGIAAQARREEAAALDEEDSEPPPRSRRVDVSPLPAAPGRRDAEAFRGDRTGEGRGAPSSRGRNAGRSSDPGRPTRAGRRHTPVPPAPRRSAPARASRGDLDFDDAREDARRRGTEARRSPLPDAATVDARREPGVPATSSTMQGTETTLAGAGGDGVDRGRRSRLARGAAFAVLAALSVVLVVLGGRRLGGFGASASEDSVEAQVEAARDCIRRRAWDTPARVNVKEITDAALARWPGDPRVLDVRREAGERMLSDALGRKYTGATGDAVHLARLALELHPQLTAAQQFVAELEPTASPSVAPADASADPGAGTARPSQGKRLPPPRASASAEPVAGPPSSAPSASAAPVLPPQPPPLPAGHAPPSSSGPWL